MPLFDSPRATMDFLCPLVSYPIRSISRSIEIDPFIGAMFSRVTNKRRNLIFRVRYAEQTCEKSRNSGTARESERFRDYTFDKRAFGGIVRTFVNNFAIVIEADTDRDNELVKQFLDKSHKL